MKKFVNRIDSLDFDELIASSSDLKREATGVTVIKHIAMTNENFADLASALGQPIKMKTNTLDDEGIVFDLRSHDTEGNISKLHKFGNSWHTDYSATERTGGFTALYCLQAPSIGGGTEFLSLDVDDVPANARAYIDSKCGIDLVSRLVKHINPIADSSANLAKHPLIYAGMNGDNYLGLGSYSYSKLVGGSTDFIKNLYQKLEYGGRSEVIACKPKQLVIWNNKFVAHRAEPYNAVNQQRRMLRIATWGEKPVAVETFAWTD